MPHSDDSYAAMLLTLALSPDKEEYARPLSTAEFRDITERARMSAARHISNIRKMDISGIMMLLDISEEFAYRVYVLLNREVQLSYHIDRLMNKGIQIITELDADYPEKLRRRLGSAAPVSMYAFGDICSLNAPSIGIMGNSGIKTSDSAKKSISAICEFAARNGYRVICGGEMGVARVAEGFAMDYGCDMTITTAGGMREYIERSEARNMLAEGHLAVTSLEHPDALFTIPHAISRNKMLMSLSESTFIFNTDMKRGESESLRARLCRWPYAMSDYPANRALIAKGATAIDEPLTVERLTEMSRMWQMTRTEQISIFDFED